jgi:hypothetical protein
MRARRASGHTQEVCAQTRVTAAKHPPEGLQAKHPWSLRGATACQSYQWPGSPARKEWQRSGSPSESFRLTTPTASDSRAPKEGCENFSEAVGTWWPPMATANS